MKIKYSILVWFLVSFLIISCQGRFDKKPTISFDTYKVTEGFQIQLAASEPLIEAPVTMDFDNQGRMWVVEMRGYMPNLAGAGEDVPNGRITILEDLGKDGVADNAKVFLDGLVLPRAIAHVYGGLLYVVPPNLWFVEINNDKPGKKTLVDSLYADVGNVEHQPNGLMLNIDNWIYSAYSSSRYQFKEGKWIKEPTSRRGQWGITKDNWGRIYYNSNETQLIGDYVLPNTLINNPYMKPKEAIDKILTDDQRVYPLHTTTVNRGAEKGILNKDSMLIKFTAACGPLIYRGDQFPDAYNQNVFVCEPQANLVKRDKLNFESVATTAGQAWNDREFIASTDEAFRPVNLFNGPDGAMYVVDMHRGVIEHRAFATPYYRSQAGIKKLDTLLHMGRILRISNKNKKLIEQPQLTSASGGHLVNLLKSTNGWVRDRAQQMLIYQQQKSVIPQLEAFAQDGKNVVTAIHALHTLDGLDALSFNLLEKVATLTDPMLSAHALVLLEKFNTKDHFSDMLALATNLSARNDAVINLYLSISLGAWVTVSPEIFLPMLANLSQHYSDKAIYQEAIVSSLKGLEENFQALIDKTPGNKSANEVINNLLSETIKNKRKKNINSIFVQSSVPVDERTNGLTIYGSTCATCHGVDGDGINHVAPSLKGSEYMEGPTDRLAMIILNGLEGPLHVNGQLYNLNGAMPNFANNFTDKQIADIIEYLHNSFVSKSKKAISPEEIKNLRRKHSGTLTEKELLKMVDVK
jgi:mono/diheme cytochrome c family protein